VCYYLRWLVTHVSLVACVLCLTCVCVPYLRRRGLCCGWFPGCYPDTPKTIGWLLSSPLNPPMTGGSRYEPLSLGLPFSPFFACPFGIAATRSTPTLSRFVTGRVRTWSVSFPFMALCLLVPCRCVGNLRVTRMCAHRQRAPSDCLHPVVDNDCVTSNRSMLPNCYKRSRTNRTKPR